MPTQTYTSRMRMHLQPLAVAVASFSVGTLLGMGLATSPAQVLQCPHHALRAHFLERSLSISTPFSQQQSSRLPVVLAVGEMLDGETDTLSSSSSATAELQLPLPTSFSSWSESSLAQIEAEESIHEAASPVPEESESETIPAPQVDAFPEFGSAVFPISLIPDWGIMRSADEWSLTYQAMDRSTFVSIPSYNLERLRIPLETLRATRDDPATEKILTEKLFYSTRFFGAYDLDSGEFAAVHPGIDLKLPEGMPVGSVAGGRVHAVRRQDTGLGIHVIVEHRREGEAFYSVYGHLQSVSVNEGDDLTAGQIIGTVGSTGNSTNPHLHLQIDRGTSGEAEHLPYWPSSLPDAATALERTVHPITFIARF